MFDESHLLPEVRWGSGKTINTSGYIMVKKPSHPNAHSNGYVPEHRLVMEFHLGRYLENFELVHHIDRNKKNNAIENLEVVTIEQHRRLHNLEDRKYSDKYEDKKDLILALYDSGQSSRDIAKKLNVGKSTVSKYVKESGKARPKNLFRDEYGRFKKG